ncbi:MAG: NFACT RNA binding domain-containing protein [Candidatus Altarchaeaceae archaeon]
MEIKLDITKTIDENAAEYYEKAKKMKEKLKGAEIALQETLKKKNLLLEKKNEISKKEKVKVKKKYWYEKFRYCFIKDNNEEFLIVGGKDATSNEILIKKYTEKNDIVLHTDIYGSPFFVIKSENREIPEKVIIEAAKICASYSRAWKENLSSVDVYYVKPEQVSKTPESGEYLKKGSFVIRGEKNYTKTQLGIFINFEDKTFISPSPYAKHYVLIIPGDIKSKEIVEKIKKFYKDKKIEIDEEKILQGIPYGKGMIKEIV